MGKTYTYEQLKRAASEARAELLSKGISIKKSARKKPRDKQKEELLYLKAINRMDLYRPSKEGDSVVLPYFLKKRK